MSKLFFDKLVDFKKLEKKISSIITTSDEKHEYWQIVDELIHHRVLHCVLNELDEKHHEEFLVKLHEAPHDEGLIDYLTSKITKDVREFLRLEIQSVNHEVLADIRARDGKTKRLAKKPPAKKAKNNK